jgi:asparagine synthase (glutamine-hydrolysing)
LIRPGEIRTLFSDQEITELLGMQPQAPVQTIASLEDLLVSDLQHYLPDMLLRDLDVFTMSHGLEARVPLLDAELQRFVWQLPAEHLRKGDTKQLLIDAVRDVLPPELLNRPKTGFEIPLGRWLRLGALRPLLDRLASGELALVRDGILRREAVAHTHAEFIQGRSHYLKPWSIIALDEWYRHFTQESAS